MLAVQNEGADVRIIAFHPSGDALPDGLAGIKDRVSYLDLARRHGKLVSGITGLTAGVAGGIRSPALLVAGLRTHTYPFGSRAATFWRRVRLGRLLQRRRPDVLHAQFAHLGLLALPAAERENIPLVISFRGQDVLLLHQVAADDRGRLFQFAARVLVRSQDMRNDLIRLDCPSEKILVRRSGVDVNTLPFRERNVPASDSDIVILSAGRLVPKKGLDDALRALAKCGTSARLRIAGDGPELGRLQRLADELDVRERVTFLGALPHEELIEEMLNAHIFLLPCRTAADGEKEGIPNSIKEAMAGGLPVVSTRHAGIPECVAHGESGLLCDEGDVDGLVHNLNTLLAQQDRWAEMGRRGRAIIESAYDLRKLASQLVQDYDEIVATNSL